MVLRSLAVVGRLCLHCPGRSGRAGGCRLAGILQRHGLITSWPWASRSWPIGVGAAELPISWPIVVALVVSASALASSMWWAYFDVSALLGEHALSQRAGGDAGRDSAATRFPSPHLSARGRTVLVALGLKKVL